MRQCCCGRFQCCCRTMFILFASLLMLLPYITISSPTSVVPNIRNDFCNPSDALEFAILCQALYGSNLHHSSDASQTPTPTPTQYNVYFHNDEFWIGMSNTKLIVTFGFGGRRRLGVQVLQGDNNEDDTDDIQVPLGPTGREFHPQAMHRNASGTGVDHVPVLVHAGFNTIFESSYEEICSILMPLLLQLQQHRTVYFIGHGLGGARAMLVGTYFAFHHPTIATHVQTFGQPRCGNLGFKILLESIVNLNVWRIVNGQDPVIRSPFHKYYHAGHLLWRRRSNNKNVHDATSERDFFAYQAFFCTIGNPQLGLAGIDDFSIARTYYFYLIL